jgi:hypothetical protein
LRTHRLVRCVALRHDVDGCAAIRFARFGLGRLQRAQQRAGCFLRVFSAPRG